MSNTSTALGQILNQVEAARGHSIEDREVFANYLAHGGLQISDDGDYRIQLGSEQSLDGTAKDISYRPTPAELKKYAKKIAAHEQGHSLYLMGDLEFILSADGLVSTRWEDPVLANYFPLTL